MWTAPSASGPDQPGAIGPGRGLELCDSWTTDAHKYLNVPYDSGLAFVRDPQAHRAAMTLSTSYLPAGGAARDQIDWNPEFSRRARGFAIYAALRELGREGVADLVDRTCRHAQAIIAGIGALPGAEFVATSQPEPGPGAVPLAAGRARAKPTTTRAPTQVIAAINASGEALFGGVTYRGRRCMRVSALQLAHRRRRCGAHHRGRAGGADRQ